MSRRPGKPAPFKVSILLRHRRFASIAAITTCGLNNMRRVLLNLDTAQHSLSFSLSLFYLRS